MASSLVDISANLHAGWTEVDVVGYYIHRGRVYLTGKVVANAPLCTQTILSGLPAEMRPPADAAVTLIADPANTSWTSDTALQLPLSYAATMHADGTFSLDAAPPAQVNAAPSVATYYLVDLSGTHHGRYSSPLELTLSLSASWTLTSLPDDYPPEDLGPFIGPDFTNIDAHYAPHAERVHLAGSVRAAVDGAQRLTITLPPDAIGGLVPADEYVTEASSGASEFVLEVNSLFGISLDSDFPIKPAGQSPPLTPASPPQSAWGVNYIDPAWGGVDSAVSLGPGDPLPSFSFDPAALLAEVAPVPDWFFMGLSYDISGVGSGVGIALSVGTVVHDDGTVASPGSSGIDGWVSAPTAEYSGSTDLFPVTLANGFAGSRSFGFTATNMLWKRGQEVTNIDVTASGHATGFNEVQFGVRLYPLYDLRQDGLHSGDVLVLTGAGWPGVRGEWPARGPLGSLSARVTAGGIRPRGWYKRPR